MQVKAFLFHNQMLHNNHRASKDVSLSGWSGRSSEFSRPGSPQRHLSPMGSPTGFRSSRRFALTNKHVSIDSSSSRPESPMMETAATSSILSSGDWWLSRVASCCRPPLRPPCRGPRSCCLPFPDTKQSKQTRTKQARCSQAAELVDTRAPNDARIHFPRT